MTEDALLVRDKMECKGGGEGTRLAETFLFSNFKARFSSSSSSSYILYYL